MSTNANKISTKTLFIIMLIGLALMQVFSAIMNYIGAGEPFGYSMYMFMTDSFRDFYDVMFAARTDNPYTYMNLGITATPLTILVIKVLSVTSRTEILDEYNSDYGIHFATTAMVFVMTMMAIALCLAIVLNSMLKYGKLGNVSFVLLTMFSAPFVFALEKGSLVSLSVLFVLLFINGQDSEKRIEKELSYVCLALAVALSIYPVLLVLMLVKGKDFIGLAKSLVYSAVLFLLPTVVFSVDALSDFFKNMKNYVDTFTDNGVAYRVDIYSILNDINLSMGNGLMDETVNSVIGIIIVLLLVVSGFLAKIKWKSILCFTVAFIAVAPVALQYSLSFLLVPMVLYFVDESKKSGIDVGYMILFMVMFAAIQLDSVTLGLSGNVGPDIYISSYIAAVALGVMIIIILLDVLLAPLGKIELDPKKRAAMQAVATGDVTESSEVVETGDASEKTAGYDNIDK